jgi:hypothetical protein
VLGFCFLPHHQLLLLLQEVVFKSLAQIHCFHISSSSSSLFLLLLLLRARQVCMATATSSSRSSSNSRCCLHQHI